MSAAFFALAETRRTQYSLTDKSTLTPAALQALVESSVKHCPTAFNSQSGRAVLVLGSENQRLWNIISEEFMKNLPPVEEVRKTNAPKLAGYSKGVGSILFFEDQAVLDANIARTPFLAECFGEWSSNSAGILQYMVWTALAAEGMGASLQHHGAYTPALQNRFFEEFQIPTSWRSTAIMPFGVAAGEANPKTFAPMEERVKVIGA